LTIEDHRNMSAVPVTAFDAAAEDFRVVFDEFRPRLIRYFRSFGFAPEDAEDLSQAALLKVHRSRTTLRDGLLFTSWVYSVARNVARDAWRRRGPEGEQPIDDALPAVTPSAERSAVDRERLELVRCAVRALPARMRVCFLLRVREELSYEEIARRLTLSTSTVKLQVWNARRRLRAAC
jgi:RNA polymerase sigma-70 factor (ECF subfamily)